MSDRKAPLSRALLAAATLLTFFVVRGAAAGEQLTIAQLVTEADAVAVVDNPLRSSIAIRKWLKGTEPVGSYTLTSPLCIPDRDMLMRWQKAHKNHEGAAVWERTLSVGHADQIVFFKIRKGVAVPLCETEVLFGQTFSTHPDYKNTLAEVERLLDEKKGLTAPPVVDETPPPVPVAAPPPPPAASGCW